MIEANTTLTRADMRARLSVVAEYVESPLTTENILCPRIPLKVMHYCSDRLSFVIPRPSIPFSGGALRLPTRPGNEKSRGLILNCRRINLTLQHDSESSDYEQFI